MKLPSAVRYGDWRKGCYTGYSIPFGVSIFIRITFYVPCEKKIWRSIMKLCRFFFPFLILNFLFLYSFYSYNIIVSHSKISHPRVYKTFFETTAVMWRHTAKVTSRLVWFFNPSLIMLSLLLKSLLGLTI